MFPVRYELDCYILFIRNVVFKELILFKMHVYIDTDILLA
jgi:hypothetical protein